jgi:hypothetical protein
MATTRPFAYNLGSSIDGTEQLGNLAIGTPTSGFTQSPKFWNGPDEDLGYVITHQTPSGQPGADGTTAFLGFFRSTDLTEGSFITLSETIAGQSFATGEESKTWLNNNGYWTSYGVSLCDSFTFNSINANTTTTSAIKTSVGGWDSSAYSLETYTNPVTLTFQTTANGNILMGGFSYNPTGNVETYVNISYGIYLQNNFIEIYENGNQVNVPGSITTLSTDVWKVEYNGTNVTYYKNNVLIYTSSNPVTQPLHTFFALYTPAEGVNNVCVIGTPSPTPTTTPTQTNTNTPTVSPTNTPTPSTSPVALTGYSFNLVALPYSFPSSGNSIMNSAGGITSGSTDINVLATGGRGFYLNSIDSESVNRTNYYSVFTGQSVTITFYQAGITAIYSGDTDSFKYWQESPSNNGFVFGAGIGAPPTNVPSGNAVLIQSATTQFTIGVPVYVSLVINPGVTPTPSPTSTQTPTQTPTSSLTPSFTPTTTPTQTPTNTQTPTPTSTNTTNLQGFSYPNFTSTDGITLVGAAAVSGGTIIALTTTTSASVGNMYRTTAIQYNRNFSAQWSSFIGGGTGADGYCVQWTTTNNTNGTSGGGVGRIESSSTINAIGFYTFTVNNFQWYKSNVLQSTTSVSAGFWRQQLYFWADYNNSAQTLSLYYNTTNSKPGSPNITYSSFSFDTGSYYMGFGAATGGNNDNHEILSWSLQFT